MLAAGFPATVALASQKKNQRPTPGLSGSVYLSAGGSIPVSAVAEIIDPKQGDFASQQGEKSAVLATFFVQIARSSRESEFFARTSG
jgi:hypothetical protein